MLSVLWVPEAPQDLKVQKGDRAPRETRETRELRDQEDHREFPEVPPQLPEGKGLWDPQVLGDSKEPLGNRDRRETKEPKDPQVRQDPQVSQESRDPRELFLPHWSVKSTTSWRMRFGKIKSTGFSLTGVGSCLTEDPKDSSWEFPVPLHGKR